MDTIRTHLLDASVLTKLVVPEHKSDTVRDYFSKNSVFWTTSFCIAEAFGALKAKRSRFGKESALDGISETVYLSALEELISMVRNGTIAIEEIDIHHRSIFDEVEQLCSKYKLDAVDTFQIVTMLRGFPSTMNEEASTILITADEKLADAAQLEGLRTWNCIKEPSPS